jgi:hypothetical protein
MKNFVFKPGRGPAQIRFALSAPFRIWKACWEINQALGIHLALFAPPILNKSFPNSEENPEKSSELDKSPEEMIYTYHHAWREYRLMTVQKAEMTHLKGFHFILEIESEKKEGLPETDLLLNQLKESKAFSAIIYLNT